MDIKQSIYLASLAQLRYSPAARANLAEVIAARVDRSTPAPRSPESIARERAYLASLASVVR